MNNMTEENTLRSRTESLVADLLDAQMKSNIMQFLWWVEYTNSIHSFQDFLDFLHVAAVQEILKEMESQDINESGLYNDVIKIAENGREQAVA
jgi:hypothetical protein